MKNTAAVGHITALLTICIWGNTFVSTKILLQDFTPVEILFFRFMIGIIALTLAYPKILKITDRRQEIYFAMAGLTGVTFYFLLENIALTYSFASSVGVLVGITPFFTALLSHFFLKGEKLKMQFFIGFLVAMTGIGLISYNGTAILKLNPLGDILAISSAAVWAVYSIIVRKISEFNYNSIQTTRRIFFYGLVFMIPALFIFDFHLELGRFSSSLNTVNILFLGLGASALCFASWSFAVRILGAVKTSVYIYLVPVVTVITSALILRERITWIAVLGTALTLLGLIISENRFSFRFKQSKDIGDQKTISP